MSESVRCWVILGGGDAAWEEAALPADRDIGGRYFIPAAGDHDPGDWFIWSGASGSPIVLLCVDLPVSGQGGRTA